MEEIRNLSYITLDGEEDEIKDTDFVELEVDDLYGSDTFTETLEDIENY